jgi:hypothetical protein
MAPRIDADVDYDEESELFHLEAGSPLPLLGGTAGSRGRGRGRVQGGGVQVQMLARPAAPRPLTLRLDEDDDFAGTAGNTISAIWGRQDIADLKGNMLCWSTVMETDGRKKNTGSKQCLFCGLTFTGGPHQIRLHLDPVAPLGGRKIRLCKPSQAWVSRYGAVLAELKKCNAAQDKDKAETDRLQAAKAEGRITAGITDKMFERVGMDEVTDAWMRVVVKKALALDLFNDPVFRKAVPLTALAGRKIVVGGDDIFLPKRKHMSSKVLPALDEKLTDKIKKKMQGVSDSCGTVLVSDGWTSESNRPILNALAALPLGLFFLEALDTSGKTKDARYIADFMIKQITKYGSDNVVGVCMDGACTASFPLIEHDFPHVFTFICPTQSLDNYMKNVCCSKDVVTLKVSNWRL